MSLALLSIILGRSPAHAGGSGLNTIVIINQNSANSIAVGNYYCERRQVPPANVVRIAWPGPNTIWTNTDFEAVLLNPLLNAITNRQLDRQVYYVVLSMDIPFQTAFDGVVNSTTSALFYGPKTETGPDWVSITNSYFGAELPFELNRPATARRCSFLAAMITAPSVAQAKRLIDRGVAADGLVPGQPVLLEKSSDPLRNFRYWTFDNAIFNAQLCNAFQVARTDSNSPSGQTNLLGFQTGLAQLSLSPNSFVPGAMADSLTSYGGIIFGPNDHTTALAFIAAGACGSYGTVTEPSPILEKFPLPQNYFYQRRGFTIAESYYQSISEPYEGLVVAEPLSAPFRRAAKGRWLGINGTVTLAGVQPLSVQFAAADILHPLQQADLFLDGKFVRTITNVTPAGGEVLTATLNGYPVAYTVPTNAPIATIAAGLAAAINAAVVPGAPRISAVSYGDRIELQAATNYAGPYFYVDHSGGAGNHYYRTVLVPSTTQPVLNPGGVDSAGNFRMHIEPPDNRPYFIEASTNLVDWAPIAQDLTGAFDLLDADAVKLPSRFYRFGAAQPVPRVPQLTALGWSGGGSFRLHVENAAPGGCLIEASTNLVHWSPITTGVGSGNGRFDFTDAAAAQFSARFYRAANLPDRPIRPRAGIVGQTDSGDSIIKIDNASMPYVLQVSTDLIHWTTLLTNTAPSRFQIAVTNSTGAGPLATGVFAARGTMMNSPALGIRRVRLYGTLALNAVAQLSFTKTNGAVVSVSVTNSSLSASVFDLAQDLVGAINNCPDLQGSDGITASDLAQGWYGSGLFNLRARSPGIEAAGIALTFSGSPGVLANPSSTAALDQNLSDLRPRNHLYVTAGAMNLSVRFPIDTRELSDGWHEIACVAYEGSCVRTQTRVNLPVFVNNSSWNTTFSITEFGSSNSPLTLNSATYHARVMADSTNISAIHLYGPGGLIATAHTQADVVFPIDSSFFGPGTHRFYSIIEKADGSSYRTEEATVRFANSHL